MRIIERNKKKEFLEAVLICLILGCCITAVGFYELQRQDEIHQMEARR